MFTLLHKLENTYGEAALLRRYVNRFKDGVNGRETTFLVQASMTRWQSTSMCLVFSWGSAQYRLQTEYHNA